MNLFIKTLLIILLTIIPVSAQTVTLAWDTYTDVATGFKLYMSPSSFGGVVPPASSYIDIQPVTLTTYALAYPVIPYDNTFFVLTAVDTGRDIESEPSNEVNYKKTSSTTSIVSTTTSIKLTTTTSIALTTSITTSIKPTTTTSIVFTTTTSIKPTTTTSIPLTTTTSVPPTTTTTINKTTTTSVVFTTTTTTSIGCAVEKIYGENSEQVKLIREYRDTVLTKTKDGQELIRTYNTISPSLSKEMERMPLLKIKIKAYIDSILPILKYRVNENKGVDDGQD